MLTNTCEEHDFFLENTNARFSLSIISFRAHKHIFENANMFFLKELVEHDNNTITEHSQQFQNQ